MRYDKKNKIISKLNRQNIINNLLNYFITVQRLSEKKIVKSYIMRELSRPYGQGRTGAEISISFSVI